ncbi:MAG TPA: hypothetical protein GXX62_03280 [Alcaligenaceae bacterium]|nr:hypothetical protein [Alcaligenaceae bacterium]
MLNTDLPHPTLKDRVTVHQAILRLTAIYKGIAIAVVAVAALVWITIISRILHFGRTLDYSGLEALGIDADLIKQYNPFFWWTVVVICTLLISYLLFNFVQYTRQRASQKIISDSDLQQLLTKISPAASHVLAWAWENRRHPITVGVLQQTTEQLGANRYSLICLAKDQESLLQQHLQPKTNVDEPLHHL